jgi:hypothetical protein
MSRLLLARATVRFRRFRLRRAVPRQPLHRRLLTDTRRRRRRARAAGRGRQSRRRAPRRQNRPGGYWWQQRNLQGADRPVLQRVRSGRDRRQRRHRGQGHQQRDHQDIPPGRGAEALSAVHPVQALAHDLEWRHQPVVVLRHCRPPLPETPTEPRRPEDQRPAIPSRLPVNDESSVRQREIWTVRAEEATRKVLNRTNMASNRSGRFRDCDRPDLWRHSRSLRGWWLTAPPPSPPATCGARWGPSLPGGARAHAEPPRGNLTRARRGATAVSRAVG